MESHVGRQTEHAWGESGSGSPRSSSCHAGWADRSRFTPPPCLAAGPRASRISSEMPTIPANRRNFRRERGNLAGFSWSGRKNRSNPDELLLHFDHRALPLCFDPVLVLLGSFLPADAFLDHFADLVIEWRRWAEVDFDRFHDGESLAVEQRA